MKTDNEPPKVEAKAISGAVFSKDREYRYVLWRIWDESKPMVMFIGLNPSTANEEKPDNTITKVKKIAYFNGYGGVYMLNLFGIVSSDPRILLTHKNPIGQQRLYNVEYARKVKNIVFCWGAFKEASESAKYMRCEFPHALCLKINADGSPKHPLYCRDDSKLIPYKP